MQQENQALDVVAKRMEKYLVEETAVFLEARHNCSKYGHGPPLGAGTTMTAISRQRRRRFRPKRHCWEALDEGFQGICKRSEKNGFKILIP
jgi:hypothetical protein